MSRHHILIAHGGRLSAVYADELQPLFERLPGLTIRRASRVEVGPDNRFYGDLSPSGGPRLGPFPTYGAAVAAERAWLQAHLDSAAAHLTPEPEEVRTDGTPEEIQPAR